ncbi:putative mitochondrial malate dehydrogenase [Leptomonas pyrrhocoris]|uniref:malate dehydrogenase n=1 Tax=Leptomonas pyrrhocoris TaxID=157538 RepID=A0A0N0DWM5_LEPPY|nr:putative mitochondrial malate dehydrogenase [Leptomonas pyrrhocoris]XP_015660435.1 putative mitochondrial malate dehydrogenase [Leptomonas pyrrhocoris]KPA81995.1 putative mitochondrial malate dehydrogenase [Leptomonas pyrrhocoris]KPA81996.1 putative mitochondrial malate dehydrogenase [Leptomonas pyrrhocoris]|eukprot:XP_015660434.1 putative mitochondrial malate dehydrogenase [Leptomonas pyrrhocoris]
MRRSVQLFFKVAVLGASGAVGQPLCLALVQNRKVSELRLYDIVSPLGDATDLSHIPRKVKVTGHLPKGIHRALEDADLVLISAGIPRSPGMFREDLFNANRHVIQDLSKEVAKYAPRAVIGIISDPLNSMVAVAAETLRQAGTYDPRKLFGISSLDTMRAQSMLADFTGNDPEQLHIPVLGGHSGQTIVPLFSQSGVPLTREEAEYLTHRVRRGGDVVVNAKGGRGSSSLSAAYAVADWADCVMRALDGEEGLVRSSMVESPLVPETTRFFASPVEFGKHGVQRVLPLPPLNEYEEEQLDRCLADLEKNIRKGLQFVTSKPSE